MKAGSKSISREREREKYKSKYTGHQIEFFLLVEFCSFFYLPFTLLESWVTGTAWNIESLDQLKENWLWEPFSVLSCSWCLCFYFLCDCILTQMTQMTYTLLCSFLSPSFFFSLFPLPLQLPSPSPSLSLSTIITLPHLLHQLTPNDIPTNNDDDNDQIQQQYQQQRLQQPRNHYTSFIFDDLTIFILSYITCHIIGSFVMHLTQPWPLPF